MIEGDIVTAIRELTNRGWGVKTISRELGIAKNTVRRYRRHPIVAGLVVAHRTSEGRPLTRHRVLGLLAVWR